MKQKFASDSIKTDRDKALVIHPDVYDPKAERLRNLDAIVEEAIGLARAIDLDTLESQIIPVQRIQAGAFFGKGQRENLAAIINVQEPDIVIVNYTLSPVQQRNLEKEFGAKVIDRTGLILEIFGARAQTKEGRLQVELAALDYQKSRLVRSWTHLERQRGGAGFMGGPGERQIELDRRMISTRMTKLKKELEAVRRTRDLGRKSRARVPFPVVALVGYTNAGKSSLFNTLTDADIFAEDLLFATLDPTLRRIDLPSGQTVILSDTVGFISDLPTHLIAAFRATLEETIHADVLLHVIDASRDDYEAQRKDVIDILQELGIEYEDDPRILEVYNKIDVTDPDTIADLQRDVRFKGNRVLISALQNKGLETLLDDVTDIIGAGREIVRYTIPYADGKALSWLHAHGEVLEQSEGEKGMDVMVDIDPADLKRFEGQFGYKH
ncbi:MAG: GTPase HflX [Alphaproteobacteria bacterium]